MSSRPATLEPVRGAPVSAPPPQPSPPPAERTRGRVPDTFALAGIFVLGAAYHAFQSRTHVSPAIFTDEILHSKLAQSFAAGHGLVVRGSPFFFPAPLPALGQAPAWLFGTVPQGYELAKILNAIVMSAAVFPAYWLARQLVRPRFALLTAAGTVAAPALVYHSYLLSESVAYPVFFLALAVMLHALRTPSLRWGLGVLGVTMLAGATRTQFLVLPLAYLLAVALGRRSELRRLALPVAGPLLAVGAVALATGGASLGPYAGAGSLELAPWDVVRWTLLTGALLPFAAGWLVFPGAVLGLGTLLRVSHRAGERAFAVLLLALTPLVLLQAGLVAAGDAHRPLERYAFYLTPLAFILFFVYVERGTPRRGVYLGLALGLGALAWLVPFPSLADYRFSFDSPVLSAYGTLAYWTGAANAATVFAAVPLAAGLGLALVRLTRRHAALVAAASVALTALTGAVTYAGDHQMTSRAREAWAASPPDWLDRTGLGQADFLALPGGSAHFGWTLEAWNRSFGRPIRLGVPDPRIDPFVASRARVRTDGVLLVDGQPAGGRLLVVNDYATRIELEGTVLEHPRPGLSLYRTPAAPHVGSLATGLYFDGWAAGRLRYQVWPRDGATQGTYRLEIALPAGLAARPVRVAVEGGPSRDLLLSPGTSARVELETPPTDGSLVPPLVVTTPRAELRGARTANPRFTSLRVLELEFAPGPPARGLAL